MVDVKGRTVRRLEALSMRLPVRWQAQALSLMFGAANPRRRGAAARAVQLDNGVYQLVWPDGSTFCIPSRERILRYVWPDGHRHALRRIFEKYQHGSVRVVPGDVVVDVGANVGEFTLAVLPFTSRVLAVEADPTALTCLRRNLAGTDAKILPWLLSNRPGIVDFYVAHDSADSSLIPPPEWGEKVSVAACTLDQARLGSVDFLKMDAEGAEPEVLAGAAETLAVTRKVAIDCSPERQGESTVAPVCGILERHGLRIEHVEPPGVVFAIAPRR